MVLDPTLDRRTVLKTLGATGALGSIGTASATPPGRGRGNDDELRLFSEQQIGGGDHGTNEVVTQQNYAYAATDIGMAVVDWRNPGRPELVARIEATEGLGDGDHGRGTAVDDGGDDTGETPDVGGVLDVKVDGDVAAMAHNAGHGITTVDVSDPENPEELAFHDAGHGIHNLFLYEDHAYLTVNESGDAAFSEARTDVVDVSDPTDPEKVGEYRLKDDFPEFAKGGVSPNHDVYVQDDLLYQAFWDTGVVVADVSDPTDPQLVAQFGDAPKADSQGYDVEEYLTRPATPTTSSRRPTASTSTSAPRRSRASSPPIPTPRSTAASASSTRATGATSSRSGTSRLRTKTSGSGPRTTST